MSTTPCFTQGATACGHFYPVYVVACYVAGKVEYYYCEEETWHTTHANGIEVFYLPNGQTEAHHPSGTKEIIFPDGVIRRVFTDGREQDVTPEQLSSPVKHPMPHGKD